LGEAARRRTLVLVGAGHAHVVVLRRFARRPVPGLSLTLVTRARFTPYSGMLPGLVAGHYSFANIHIDGEALAQAAGARLVLAEAVGLDGAERRVLFRDHPPVPYHLLSLDVGSGANTALVPGAAEHAIAVKPIDGFLAQFEALRLRVQAGRSRHVLLVGGGAGGVEMVLSVAHRLRRDGAEGMRCTLVAGSADILPGFPPAFRARLRAVLTERGIAVRTGAQVVRVGRGGITLANGTQIAADEVLWATEAAPVSWLAGTGLALDEDGFLRVDSTLRVIGQTGIFAAGDMIAFDPAPLPRSGVYAVRAGPVLAANLRATVTGGRLRSFRPQRQALSILSTGERCAVLTRNGVTLGGHWVWRLKDWIDRGFVGGRQGLCPGLASLKPPATPAARPHPPPGPPACPRTQSGHGP
jgi:selenide, water dikinase